MWRDITAIALLLAPVLTGANACTCQEDTQILIDELDENGELSAIFDQISNGDGVRIDSASQTLLFNNDYGLISDFDIICREAGGITLLTNVRIEECEGFPYDYEGYPNCISETCGGTPLDIDTKTAVLKGLISDGLGLNFDGPCTTEIFFTHFDYYPSFSCGYDGDGDGDGDGVLLEDKLFALGHDETCVNHMIAGRGTFDKAMDTLIDYGEENSTSVIYHFNNNATALSLYAVECASYKGEIALVHATANENCITEDEIELVTSYDDIPICVPKSCKDYEAESLFVTFLEHGKPATCDVEFSIVGTLIPSSRSNKKTKNSAKQEYSKKSPKNVMKARKKKQKKKGKSYEQAHRSQRLKCVADMAIIHGNDIGMDPYEKREFVLANMVYCSPSTDNNPICMYNGNAPALAQYTTECGSMNGRVVQTEWLFADGCDGREDREFINWIGVHDCVASSCTDAGSANFFNTVSFDPTDTSCYADVSILSMMPAQKMKVAKNTKARRMK